MPLQQPRLVLRTKLHKLLLRLAHLVSTECKSKARARCKSLRPRLLELACCSLLQPLAAALSLLVRTVAADADALSFLQVACTHGSDRQEAAQYDGPGCEAQPLGDLGALPSSAELPEHSLQQADIQQAEVSKAAEDEVKAGSSADDARADQEEQQSTSTGTAGAATGESSGLSAASAVASASVPARPAAAPQEADALEAPSASNSNQGGPQHSARPICRAVCP